MTDRPRLLLVGQDTRFPWVFDSAVRAGVDLVLVPRPGTTPSERPPIVEILPADYVGGPDAALRVIEDRHRRSPLAGVMAGSELTVPFVARCAAALGLPGLSEDAAWVVRDKRRMRERLLAAGLDTPRFVVPATADRWREAAGLRFPVVVKPAGGYSSLGVTRVDDPADVEAAVRRTWSLPQGVLPGDADMEGLVIVEEYLDGPEISVESVVHDGEVQVCAVSLKGDMPGPYFEEVTMRAPAPFPSELSERIAEETVAAHSAFGVTMGVTETEMRIVDGRPVVIEMAARMGGGGIMHHMVEGSTGIDYAGEAVRLHIGRVPGCWGRTPVTRSHAGLYFVPVGAGGRVKQIHGLDEVERRPDVDRVVRLAGPGDTIPPYPAWSSYIACVQSRHACDAEVVEFQELLSRSTGVEYE